MQWKLTKTFSNWIQRAGRAARGRGRTGLAVLLVEPSAYARKATDTSRDEEPHHKGRGKTVKGKVATRKTASEKKMLKEYARSHGVKRGSCERLDERPSGVHPPFNPDANDEGLLRFVQATECRRTVWAEMYEAKGMGARKYQHM